MLPAGSTINCYTIYMNKTCNHCQKEFTITEEELGMYGKVGIEIPEICFKCRVGQQFAFWPFGKFRVGKSDYSGEQIITTYPENPRFPIYTNKEWHSDVWDGLSYGTDYDESRSFFDQIKELQEKVPRPHHAGVQNTNCDWCDDSWRSKDCYLSRSMEECEGLYYGYRNFRSKNSIDMTFCFDLENSYDCTYCFKSYNLKYSINSRDCVDSYFLYDCRNCSNCFLSYNLRNKMYCIENVQYSKEEYFEKLKEYNLTSRKSINTFKDKLNELIKNNVIHRETFNSQIQKSTGDFLAQVNNCINCFGYSESEEVYNAVRGFKSVTTIDCNGCWYLNSSGNSFGCVHAYGLKYCSWSPSRYSEYLDLCEECEYCFGCVGLKKKKYCILNKQYTKEAYETLKEKIIADMKNRGEYGQFFPYSMSLLPYNLSTASFYVPKTKEEVQKLGGYWFDGELTQVNGEPSSLIPDSLVEVEDSITTKPFICDKSGFRFNIAQNELAFYRKWEIPLPNTHFDVRTRERLSLLTSIELHNSKCFFCSKDIRISYKPEWGYKKIACEDCYKKEVL